MEMIFLFIFGGAYVAAIIYFGGKADHMIRDRIYKIREAILESLGSDDMLDKSRIEEDVAKQLQIPPEIVRCQLGYLVEGGLVENVETHFYRKTVTCPI